MRKILILMLIITFGILLSACNNGNDLHDYPDTKMTDVDAWGTTGHYTVTVEMKNKGGEGDVRLEIIGKEMGIDGEEVKVVDDIFPIPAATDYMVEYDIKNESYGRFHFTLHQWTEDGFEKIETIEDVKTY